jgi:D-alanyl-D-alanine dipeptidase
MLRAGNRFRQVLLCFTGLFAAVLLQSARAEEMPEDIVYLRDIDPSIQQDMRYAGGNNFTGQPVPGYNVAECVLVRQAAEALKAAQTELRSKSLSLKVYDCYRPARAVAAFVAWSKLPDDPREKALHYPDLAKSELFPAYIATRSSHSRGATVDITLVPLDAPRQAETSPSNGDVPCTAPQAGLRHGLDMGIGFDCFDPKANTDAPGLTRAQRHNRELLLDIMSRHGFQNYKQEIWHFTLKGEPYPDTIFDFPIEPRARGKG